MSVLILVVDDEPDVTDLFRQQFRRELRAGRFAMEFAQSAAEALDHVAASAGTSLILMFSDINMPGMTGLELLPIVRAARPDVPVIMITAYGDAETRALALPAASIEQAVVSSLPAEGIDRILDIGTGTGRMLELLAPRVKAGLGVDASRAMLALARARLAKPGLGHLSVCQADMYSLPVARRFDLVLMHMVLHYAEDPRAALAEATRAMVPGGMLLVVDLARHDRSALADRLAHRWPGFGEAEMAALFAEAGLQPGRTLSVAGPLDVWVWTATLPAEAPARSPELEFAQ